MTALPTRAEFIRDRLAEWCDGYGMETEIPVSSGPPRLRVATLESCADLSIETDGTIYDIGSGPAILRGFTWTAEPTDTGMVHGPIERLQAPCALCSDHWRAAQHSAGRILAGTGHSYR